jgi:hypothetical protein
MDRYESEPWPDANDQVVCLLQNKGRTINLPPSLKDALMRIFVSMRREPLEYNGSGLYFLRRKSAEKTPLMVRFNTQSYQNGLTFSGALLRTLFCARNFIWNFVFLVVKSEIQTVGCFLMSWPKLVNSTEGDGFKAQHWVYLSLCLCIRKYVVVIVLPHLSLELNVPFQRKN